MKREDPFIAVIVACTAFGVMSQVPTPLARAALAPDVEYTYDVVARRHYSFPNDDAISYGYGICGKVSSGEGYREIMGGVKQDVLPNDEFAANYLVSYAVGILCPGEIWQLRNTAAGYQAPSG